MPPPSPRIPPPRSAVIPSAASRLRFCAKRRDAQPRNLSSMYPPPPPPFPPRLRLTVILSGVRRFLLPCSRLPRTRRRTQSKDLSWMYRQPINPHRREILRLRHAAAHNAAKTKPRATPLRMTPLNLVQG